MNNLELIRRSLQQNFVSSGLFSTVLHKKSAQEENIIKARNFRFTRFFRAPDLKTDTRLTNFRSSNRRTILR